MTTPAPTPAPGKSTPAGTAKAPNGAAGKLATDTLKALSAALGSENAAVWSYGLIAAYDTADADEIASITAGHLARRDATATTITVGGGKPTPPAPAYSLPSPVTDPKSAVALAVIVETDCAAAWRAVLGGTDDLNLRAFALAGLSDSAVWLTILKLAAKASPPTVPFPGQSS